MEENLINKEIIGLKKHLQTFLNESFKEHNLKSAEIQVIHILSILGEESQAELAKKLNCDKSHIHRTVFKLLLKKIIIFSNNENKRKIKILLTEYGKEIAEKINKKIKDWKLKITEGISKEEIEITKVVFQKIIDNINKEDKNV